MFKLLLLMILLASPVFAVEQYITAPQVVLPAPPASVISYPQTQFVRVLPSYTAPLQKNPWTTAPSQGFEKTTNYIRIYPGMQSGYSPYAP